MKKTMQIGVLGAVNGMRIRSWYEGQPTADVVELCHELRIPVFETDYTNGDETIRLFREGVPDLGLSLGNGYISRRVFSIPKYGMINAHGERLPEYQNAQSVIWPIYHLETKTGVTIHQIDSRIDTGNILYRDEYPIVFCDRLENTVRHTIDITQQRTPPAVRYVCENYKHLLDNSTPQEKGRSFTTPSFWQFMRMTRNNSILYNQQRAMLAERALQ